MFLQNKNIINMSPELEKSITMLLKKLERVRDRELPVRAGRAVVYGIRDNFNRGGFYNRPWKTPIRSKAGFRGSHGAIRAAAVRDQPPEGFDRLHPRYRARDNPQHRPLCRNAHRGGGHRRYRQTVCDAFSISILL